MTQIAAIDAAHLLMPAVFGLRHEVFVVEQGGPQELEVEADDTIATHLVALLDDRVVGTLRIVHHAHTAKIGRDGDICAHARARNGSDVDGIR